MSASHFPRTCPIAHLIPRVPYGIAHNDSSLMAAGGYCPAAQLWWYPEWPPAVQALTLRHITKRRDPSLVSINSLEYAAQLITMLGCHLHDNETSKKRHDPHPIFLLECDNPLGTSMALKGMHLQRYRLRTGKATGLPTHQPRRRLPLRSRGHKN